MLGFNTKNVVRDEADALSSTGREFEWDMGDDARAIFYGLFGKDYSKETLKNKVLEEQTKRYNEDPKVKTATQLALQTNPGASPITRRPGESLTDLQVRAGLAQRLGENISTAKQTYEGIDLTGVKTQSDLDNVISSYRRDKTGKIEAKEKAKETKEEDRYNLYQERLWQDRQESRKERALTRELNAENNAMQMQLEYARLAQSDRQKSRDRKDQAIMALIQGLGNLGTAFTI